MHKIDSPNATGAGEFTDGDDGLGILATEVWSKWLNTIQREVIAPVEFVEMELSDEDDTQLLQAMQAMIAAAVIPSGSTTVWRQSAAPTGWTKVVTDNNKALRVVSGAAGSGGSVDFTAAFANTSVGATTLSTAQMPSHPHDTVASDSSASSLTSSNHVSRAGNIYGGEQNYTLAGSGTTPTLGPSQSVGGGGSHDHTINLAVKYLDVIVATKN